MARSLTRRRMLVLVSFLGLSPLISLGLKAAQQMKLVGKPPPTHTLAERMAPILNGRTPKTDRLALDVPDVAEDGSIVPVKFQVKGPLSAQKYVQRVHVLVDNNPDPLIFSATLTPALGAAEISTRIRMAKTSAVRVIAEMSTGELYTAEKVAKVTIGGCEN